MWSCARPRACRSSTAWGRRRPAGRCWPPTTPVSGEAVAYLDEHLGTRRGHGGVQHVSGQGLLAVGFDHRTSREGDPLLHTHLVVANRVQGPDGRWTALDGRDLYRHRLAADAIYRASYQRELVRTLGVEWTAADAHGNRELQGLPEELVRLFSKRTDQIDLEVERLEADGRERTPRLVKWAVQATRKPKEHEAAGHPVWTVADGGGRAGRGPGHPGPAGDRPDTRPRPGPDSVRADGGRGVRSAGRSGRADRDRVHLRPPGRHRRPRRPARRRHPGRARGAGRPVPGRADGGVVAERALEERRWSTPELLAVEQRLVAAATGRAGEQTAVVSHDAVRAALAGPSRPPAPTSRRWSATSARAAPASPWWWGGPGPGKTFALGMARHAWQLDGYRPLATAPTGIATVSLEAEGFEEVATCDRLLADLDRGREQLDGRTVLVVDEAGMLGSRKLARLLDHAQQAQAKVVLVGDDRQLAAIDAGGGFRALRLRLGASELTENRRQQQAWEREALELVRVGLVEEAVAAYRAHDRVVAADSKPAATLALLQDWWQAWQDAERDPAQDVIVLAGRRAEVDRLNTACQQLLAARGRLGPERLQVEDRQLAVGDRVVCGRNAIAQLGVANGTRGTITALDPQARTLTIRVDGKEPREVTLPGWYLDGRQRGERNRRVDLAYATTGHRAQGLTRWRALVRLTGTRGQPTGCMCSCPGPGTRPPCTRWSGPNPKGRPSWTCPTGRPGDGYAQLAQALSRAGDQTLGDRHPQQPGPAAAVDRRAAGRTRPAPRPARPGPPGSGPGAGAGQRPPGRGRPGPGAAHRQQRPAAPGPGDASPALASRAGRRRLGGGGGGPPAGRPRPRHRAGAAPASAAPGRLAGGQRPPRPRLPPGRPGAGLAAPRPRPGRRARPARLPARRARPGARVAPGGGGPGGRPPPPSRTTAAPTRSPTPSRRWARRRASPPSGPPGSTPAAAAQRTKDRQRTDRDRQERSGSDPPSPQSTAASRTSRPRPRRAGARTPAWPGAGRRLAPAKEASHGQAPAPARPRRPVALL